MCFLFPFYFFLLIFSSFACGGSMVSRLIFLLSGDEKLIGGERGCHVPPLLYGSLRLFALASLQSLPFAAAHVVAVNCHCL